MKEANNILLETEHIKKVFGEHEVLKDINLSSLDTRNLQNMSKMFYNCAALK